MNSLKFFAFVFTFTFFSGHQIAEAGRVILYEDEHYTGPRRIVTLGPTECLDLIKGWNDNISSIDPQGACVIIFKDHGCTGRGIRMEQYHYGTDQLSKLEFNDEMSSLRLC